MGVQRDEDFITEFVFVPLYNRSQTFRDLIAGKFSKKVELCEEITFNRRKVYSLEDYTDRFAGIRFLGWIGRRCVIWIAHWATFKKFRKRKMQIGEKKKYRLFTMEKKLQKMWKSNPLLNREIFFIII